MRLSYYLHMEEMQVFPTCAAVVADIVSSRASDRGQSHTHVLDAIAQTNANIAQLDPLRVTVGDEIQGVYATLGDAFAATFTLRNLLAGHVDLRFGIGVGEVRIIDAKRGIQDGSAWVLAREAIEAVERQSHEPGRRGLRTAVRDDSPSANPLVEPAAQLIDAHLAALGAGARASFSALYEGLDNQQAAERLGITASANSQRVNNNQLRPLLAMAQALTALGGTDEK